MFKLAKSKTDWSQVTGTAPGVIHWMNIYPLDNAFGFPNTYLLDSVSHNQAIGNKNFLKLTYFIFVADFNEIPMNLFDWAVIL